MNIEQISITWIEAERYNKLKRKIIRVLKLKLEVGNILKEGVNIDE